MAEEKHHRAPYKLDAYRRERLLAVSELGTDDELVRFVEALIDIAISEESDEVASFRNDGDGDGNGGTVPS